MSEEVKDILEEIRFKAGIYKDQKRRNEAFNDENYNCFMALNYIQEKDEEIERLNNKLKDIKSQLDYLETYSSKEDVFEDMKRRLDRIDKIIGSE